MQAIAPVWWDWLVVALLCVGAPALSALVSVPAIRALPRAQQDKARPRLYFNIMANLVVFGTAALLPWLLRDEPLHAIGLGAPGEMWLWAAGGMAALAVLVLTQRAMIRSNPDGRAAVRRQLRKVRWVIPRTRGELALWALICVLAGIGEELLYRGYLFALASHFMPDLSAGALVTLMFGLAHAYQGCRGVMYTAVVGAGFMALAWFSGSLWLPMLAHALYDWHAGTLGRWALYGRYEPT